MLRVIRVAFGSYLSRFAFNYVNTYAGLASVMIAIVFLYMLASIFIFGGEFNASLINARARRATRRAAKRASRPSNQAA